MKASICVVSKVDRDDIVKAVRVCKSVVDKALKVVGSGGTEETVGVLVEELKSSAADLKALGKLLPKKMPPVGLMDVEKAVTKLRDYSVDLSPKGRAIAKAYLEDARGSLDVVLRGYADIQNTREPSASAVVRAYLSR